MDYSFHFECFWRQMVSDKKRQSKKKTQRINKPLRKGVVLTKPYIFIAMPRRYSISNKKDALVPHWCSWLWSEGWWRERFFGMVQRPWFYEENSCCSETLQRCSLIHGFLLCIQTSFLKIIRYNDIYIYTCIYLISIHAPDLDFKLHPT